MNPAEMMKERTKKYGLRSLRLAQVLFRDRTGRIIGRQLLRAGTSVGANYRAACRARSRADFVSKMGIVEEECDESLYWMELALEAKLLPVAQLSDLMREGNEILAIVVSSIRTARARKLLERAAADRSSIRNPHSAIRNPEKGVV